MSVTCFPDNTVLINFGFIGRIDLLEKLLPTRMWCLTVSRECRQSFSVRGFTTYESVRKLFGEPLVPTGGERINTQQMRDDIASPEDKPDAHMGEAETITIAKSRRFSSPMFVTDDKGATALAKQEGLGVITTWMLIKMAVRRKHLTEAEAYQDALTLRQNKRGWPVGIQHTHADFIAWLRQL